MKIGIMTHWWLGDNYGQILQCYALQKYLRDAGHDAYLIRYLPKDDAIKRTFYRRLINIFYPAKLWNFLVCELYSKKRRAFKEFLNENIKKSEKIYYSYNQLKADPPVADVYIVGSDQVWNYFESNGVLHEGRIRAFCLDFGNKKIKKIAWAASFGKDNIDSVIIEKMTPLLKQFEYISVREKTGIEICRKCGIENVEWTIDPTMMINADDYRSLYRKSLSAMVKPKSSYCFLYLLGNDDIFLKNKIYRWAAEKKLKVIYITGNSRYDNSFRNTYATISEWIYLLDEAECVITNSYHAAIFALIFQKDFYILPRVGEYTKLNDRFLSLFMMFGIDNRMIDIIAFEQKEQIQWKNVNIILQQMRNSVNLKEVIEKKCNA